MGRFRESIIAKFENISMKNVTKLAKKSAGLSQKCSICPLMQRCTLEIHRACFDSFVEGFKKGARAAEKEINKKFKSQ